MNINSLMELGISKILKAAAKFSIRSSKERKFIAGLLPEIQKSARKRDSYEQNGTHVPPFLIASISERCNLHCAGCYARANGICCDNSSELDTSNWEGIFSEASDLGVSFVLLAGGEPLMRKDIILAAAKYSSIVFPVFTNGSMVDEEYLKIFDTYRNLIPVLSLEGDREQTDSRRGAGTYDKVMSVMKELKSKNILFGVSITVNRQNLKQVTSPAYATKINKLGCGAMFFVEYVPIQSGTEELELEDNDLLGLKGNISYLKKHFSDMAVISFPGDEEAMGGCLASGRGFFHINPQGGAEPCPFSPYAVHNLATSSIAEVLSSDFFKDIRKITACEHKGGCVLFNKKSEVEAAIAKAAE